MVDSDQRKKKPVAASAEDTDPPPAGTGTESPPGESQGGGVSLNPPRSRSAGRGGPPGKPDGASIEASDEGCVEHPSPDARKPTLQRKPKCPECGALMEPEDVFCVHCGFNRNTGTRPAPPVPQKSKPILPWLLLAAILAAGAVGYWWWLKNQASEPAVPDLPAIEPDAAAAPEPAPPPAEPVAEPEPPTVEEEAPPTAEPAPEPVPPARRAEARAAVEGRLDRQIPVLASGDNAILRTGNGKTYRGAFTGVEEGIVRLESAGTRYEIRVENLDRGSRARVDAAYRTQLIDKLTEDSLAR